MLHPRWLTEAVAYNEASSPQVGRGHRGEWHLAPGLPTAAPAIPAAFPQTANLLVYQWERIGDKMVEGHISDGRIFNFFEVIAVDQERWGVPLKPGFELRWICRIRLWIEFDLFFMAFVYSSKVYDVHRTAWIKGSLLDATGLEISIRMHSV